MNASQTNTICIDECRAARIYNLYRNKSCQYLVSTRQKEGKTVRPLAGIHGWLIAIESAWNVVQKKATFVERNFELIASTEHDSSPFFPFFVPFRPLPWNGSFLATLAFASNVLEQVVLHKQLEITRYYPLFVLNRLLEITFFSNRAALLRRKINSSLAGLN